MRERRLQLLCAGITAVACLSGGCASTSQKREAGTLNAAPVPSATDRGSTPILTSSDPAIFPVSWRAAPINASGEALPADRVEQVSRVLRGAMAKYPEGVLRTHLRAVYALAQLRYNDILTSGTNSRDCVYLKIGEPAQGFTDAHIERTFHAEFSSILLRNRAKDFDAGAWQAANPPGFTYLGSGVDAVKQRRAGLAMRAELHEQGFLNEYAKSTMENDFNGIAAMLFRGESSLWETAEKFPRIRAKLELSIRFYQTLDPSLNESYFRSLQKR